MKLVQNETYNVDLYDDVLWLLREILEDTAKHFKTNIQEDKSVPIGGNFLQVRSGNISYMSSYSDSGSQYTLPKQYLGFIKVGTNASVTFKDVAKHIQAEIVKRFNANSSYCLYTKDYDWSAKGDFPAANTIRGYDGEFKLDLKYGSAWTGLGILLVGKGN